jgi:hypothetical protein
MHAPKTNLVCVRRNLMGSTDGRFDINKTWVEVKTPYRFHGSLNPSKRRYEQRADTLFAISVALDGVPCTMCDT